ncbi:MAG: NFACT family protein [Leptolyngbyaceae cyanobacterium]
MQPVDVTTLMATCADLRQGWLPARCEQIVQRDRTTLCIALRTLKGRDWLTISWHPQAARLHIGAAPPKQPDTFTFSQQLKHQLNGLALVSIEPVAPWERALDLCFARRPGDPVLWHLYVEIMGKYSNVILVNHQNQIVTAAHQVSEQQSSVRPILTGAPYALPPALTGPRPALDEPQNRWQERIALVPNPLKKALIKAYCGLSSALVRDLVNQAELELSQSTATLTDADWDRLFNQWQRWLHCLSHGQFYPQLTAYGYTMIGPVQTAKNSLQEMLQTYYSDRFNRQEFERLHHQLGQVLKGRLRKLSHKADGFCDRLDQATQADQYRQQADLLMAYSHQWQPGLETMTVDDFETGEPVTLALDPDKTAIQTAQQLYKRHQKLKRSRDAIAPLLAEVQQEIAYLEQVDAARQQIETYAAVADLIALQEIRDELVQEGYLKDPTYRPQSRPAADRVAVRKFATPNGLAIWVGRNNHQNDQIVSHLATDYDLWFHTQEIPGSHVLLRLSAGEVPSDADLQYVADIAAYFSRAQQADQVPVVYTEPRHVYKPKGAHPGMVIYKHERVLWGQPQQAKANLTRPADPALALA